MKKVSAIIFSIGSAFVGSAITYFVTRHIFQKKLEKAVKAAQEDARVVYVPTTPTSSYINLSDLPPLKVEDLMKDYSPESENMDEKSQEIAHEEKHDEPDEESTDPYITTDEEFMEVGEKIYFKYYNDGVIADDRDRVVRDPEVYLGKDILERIDKQGDNPLYVVNPALAVGIEIEFCLENYGE